MKELHGVITALITPLLDHNKLDIDGISELIEFQINSGVNGFFISGTTGEGIILDIETRKKLLERVLEFSKSSIIHIFQVGSAKIDEVKELVKHAFDLNIDAIASFPPIYYPYDNNAILEYYVEISSLTDTPFIIYNIPPRTGINVDYKLVREIKDKSQNIVGLKDSSGSIRNTMQYLDIKDFIVLIGSDTISLPGLIIGCKGVVSALSNVFPELFVEMYRDFKEKNLIEAQRKFKKIFEIRQVFRKYPYVASYKAALNIRGLNIKNVVNKPLRKLSDEEINKLKQELEQYIQT